VFSYNILNIDKAVIRLDYHHRLSILSIGLISHTWYNWFLYFILKCKEVFREVTKILFNLLNVLII